MRKQIYKYCKLHKNNQTIKYLDNIYVFKKQFYCDGRVKMKTGVTLLGHPITLMGSPYGVTEFFLLLPPKLAFSEAKHNEGNLHCSGILGKASYKLSSEQSYSFSNAIISG